MTRKEKRVLYEYIVNNITENVKKIIRERFKTKESKTLLEMARINKRETGKCFFPYTSWEIKIWSNDHNPPHFHILKDGWNVSFLIEDGSIYKIERKGENKQIYEYMVNNVQNWLSTNCFALPKITNKENAILQWEQLHDE